MSNELEAFIEYITVTKALSPRTVEAYRNDLTQLETRAAKALLLLDSTAVFSYRRHRKQTHAQSQTLRRECVFRFLL